MMPGVLNGAGGGRLISHRAFFHRGGSAAGLADELGDERGPAGLVAGSESGTVVPVKIFVERRVVFPVGVGLEIGVVAEDRASAGFGVAEEDPREPMRDLVGGVAQGSQAV